VIHDHGDVALDVILNKIAVREFALFTTNNFGHVVELRFPNAVLARPLLQTPALNGNFQVSLVNPPTDEKGVAEIARQLSSGSAVIESRVVEAKR
jgi:hypothetical protein